VADPTTKTVPLVASHALSEFGDLHQLPEFRDPGLMDRDQSYVPGFAEARRQYDLDRAEHAAGRRSAGDIRTLPVNLRWARNQNRAGANDNAKVFSHSRRGYRLVTKEDIGQDWLTELPQSGQLNADGTIRNGDTVLMVATADAAARNEARKRREGADRLSGSVNAFEQQLQAAHVATRGNDPYVTKLASPDGPAAAARKTK
jgi:hypothetical protein